MTKTRVTIKTTVVTAVVYLNGKLVEVTVEADSSVRSAGLRKMVEQKSGGKFLEIKNKKTDKESYMIDVELVKEYGELISPSDTEKNEEEVDGNE